MQIGTDCPLLPKQVQLLHQTLGAALKIPQPLQHNEKTPVMAAVVIIFPDPPTQLTFFLKRTQGKTPYIHCGQITEHLTHAVSQRRCWHPCHRIDKSGHFSLFSGQNCHVALQENIVSLAETADAFPVLYQHPKPLIFQTAVHHVLNMIFCQQPRQLVQTALFRPLFPSSNPVKPHPDLQFLVHIFQKDHTTVNPLWNL